MSAARGTKVDNFSLSNGGRADAQSRRKDHADIVLESAIRELHFAMRRKNGKSINKNFRNVACGRIKLIRAYMRRIKELKAARNDAHNYPLAKATVREIDQYVDRLFIAHLRSRKEPDRAA